MAVVVGFHRGVISCELALPKPRGSGNAAAEFSACGFGNAASLTFILDKVVLLVLIGL